MTTEHITAIPIHEIRVVNPRSRNRVKFHGIMTSIGAVGLKRPITVHERPLEEDGTRYDLVCGQGRLEAVRDLGDTMIPAILSDAPEEERYLMSLVENLARRPPSNTEILREVTRLKELDHRPAVIAQKLGLDRTYVYGIVKLLQHGENDLIARVEAGTLPLDTAVTIAAGKDADIQQALSEAYESGLLRGPKLRDVQRLISRRRKKASPGEQRRQLSGNDLVRAYEHHTQQQRSLVRRSAAITQRLAILTSSFRRLWADDHFLTLLRAEGLQTAPDPITARVAGANMKEMSDVN
jgi:ParB family chromosome partitioning protein